MQTTEEWWDTYAVMFNPSNETEMEEISQRAFFKGFFAAVELFGVTNGPGGKEQFSEIVYQIYGTLEEIGAYDLDKMLKAKKRLKARP